MLFEKKKQEEHNIVSLLENRRKIYCNRYRFLKCMYCPYCVNITGKEVECPQDETYRTCAIDRVIQVEKWNSEQQNTGTN